MVVRKMSVIYNIIWKYKLCRFANILKNYIYNYYLYIIIKSKFSHNPRETSEKFRRTGNDAKKQFCFLLTYNNYYLLVGRQNGLI